jgi:subtilisin family serine protease
VSVPPVITRRVMMVVLALLLALPAFAGSTNAVIGINVVLNTAITDSIVADLAQHGKVRDIVPEINALTVIAPASELPAIQAESYVASANADQKRDIGPTAPLAVSDFSAGLSTWDLDAVNVTNPGVNNRTVAYDGSGVYVAVLDTGLVSNWTYYFPTQRIATQYAKSFGGGGADLGTVSEQPNKWEQDQHSHGTHVTSTILGYNFGGTYVNGVAPKATVIPVKVLNQAGSGWSSVIARGIVYIADLKAGELAASPVVINMSLGGPGLDAMEKAAIDYAVGQGVIIVASAGNEDNHGMGYPGAYAPVISVAATGWIGEWVGGRSWWYARNVPDPTDVSNYYITDFSSRALAGQDLDVSAPGSWVVGPFQVNGQLSYYFLGGTSMASPHVAGIVALMAQKSPALTASVAESILESTAAPMNSGCRAVNDGFGAIVNMCWGPGHDPATSLDADGSGFATADAALDALGGATTSRKK